MATYSNAPNVSGVISTDISNSGASGTYNAYTVPADSYAILNIEAATISNITSISMGGLTVWNGSPLTPSGSFAAYQYYLGPGHSVEYVKGAGTGTFKLRGIEFTNGN